MEAPPSNLGDPSPEAKADLEIVLQKVVDLFDNCKSLSYEEVNKRLGPLLSGVLELQEKHPTLLAWSKKPQDAVPGSIADRYYRTFTAPLSEEYIAKCDRDINPKEGYTADGTGRESISYYLAVKHLRRSVVDQPIGVLGIKKFTDSEEWIVDDSLSIMPTLEKSKQAPLAEALVRLGDNLEVNARFIS